MTENTVNEPGLDAAAMVDAAFDDPELAKLPLGSDEFNAAVAERAAKTTSDEDLDESADDQTEQEEQTEDTEKPKKRGTTKRIDELTAKVRQLERELSQTRYQQAPGPEEIVQETSFDKPEPKWDDFEDIKDYTKALARWQFEQLKHEEALAQQAAEMEQKTETTLQTWRQKEADLRKAHPDYDEVVTVDAVQRANPSHEARVFLSEVNGPELIYQLMSSGLAEEFASLSPLKQVAMLARLETASKPKTIASKTPVPPPALNRGKATPTTTNLLQSAHEMSFAEWDAAVDRALKRR